MPDPAAQPDPFSLLAPPLQRAIWDMRWASLRPIQQDAIRAWHDQLAEGGGPDLLIMAQTAAGKTEAAFLPVLSHIAADPDASVRALYIGPLKALINDQFQRVELLCRHMDLAVHRWHGDVAADAKSALTKAPSGVLLITPESLESLLINRTTFLPRLFSRLAAVVIDELHAFLENERGLHLASLLSRVTRYVAGGARPRRIGLSATIGDPMAAARYLNPDAAGTVRLIESRGEEKELLLRVHWYAQPPAPAGAADVRTPAGPQPAERPERPTGEQDDAPTRAIAADLVRLFHDSTNLVFCNSKSDIEVLADAANAICRERALEPRFHVHHASVSRQLREDTEAQMKDPPPDTAICSSTLEMGIDIGSVRTVGQVGPPWSVASLKQRVGRSGRKDGQSRRLRIFLTSEAHAAPDASATENPEKRLPLDLLQTIAVLELMITDRWVEPPTPPALDLSTLTQQIISTIAETGGIRADELHARLCMAGPFRAVTPPLFARVLRSLGSRDVVEQTGRGDLILGLVGERLRAERDFYAAFSTPREYSVRAGDSVLGSLPIVTTPIPGQHLVLGGRRWQVESVDMQRLEVTVIPARGASRPRFSGGVGEVHPRIRERMLEVLSESLAPANGATNPDERRERAAGTRTPDPAQGQNAPSVAPQRCHDLAYLDPAARAELASARELASRERLAARRVLEAGANRSVVLTWSGTRAQGTLVAMLAARGIVARAGEVCLHCEGDAAGVLAALRSFQRPPPAPAGVADRGSPAPESVAWSALPALELARHVHPKGVRKFDEWLDEAVLEESIAADRLDVPGAMAVVAALTA